MAQRTKTNLGVLKKRGKIVVGLYSSLNDGGSALHLVPEFVKRCLGDDCWRQRYDPHVNQILTCGSFEEFITARPPRGMGTDLRTLKNLCRDDVAALALIDKEVANPIGTNQYSDEGVYNIHNQRPAGTSRDAILRRLRKNRPDLYQKILRGELTCNAAMIEAGFRKKPTNLELLQKTWAKTIAADRALFLTWVQQ